MRVASYPASAPLSRRRIGSPRWVISCNHCHHVVRKALPADPRLRASRIYGAVTMAIGLVLLGGGLLTMVIQSSDILLWAVLIIAGISVAVAGVNGLVFGLAQDETDVRMG